MKIERIQSVKANLRSMEQGNLANKTISVQQADRLKERKQTRTCGRVNEGVING